jgi:superfamily II DNA or RNA helicase
MADEQQDIHLAIQRHDAFRAGLHYDWRIVLGDKAYSFATRKEMPPAMGKLILHEQPVHTAHYAFQKKIEIPRGQYGGGTTTLDYVQRGKAKFKHGDYYELNLNNGDRFYIKKMPSYGDKAWLLVNLTGVTPKAKMEKKAKDTKHERQSPVLRALGAGAAATAVGHGAAFASLALHHHERRPSLLQRKLYKGFTKEIGHKHSVQVVNDGGLGGSFAFKPGMGKHKYTNFMTGKRHIIEDKSEIRRPKGFKNFSTMMHEAGHMKDFSTHLNSKGAIAARGAFRMGGPLAGFVLGTAALNNKKTEKYAPLIAAAPAIPTLLEEGKADYHAASFLARKKQYKELGKFVSKVSTLPKLSYAGGYLAPAAAIYAAHKAMQHNRNNGHHKKSEYLEKIALAQPPDSEPSQEHQERVVQKLKTNHPRLIAFHGLGSGKTLTGLRAIQHALKGDDKKTRALFITPASLTKNVEKEMKKHNINIPKHRLKIMSYEKAVRGRDKLLEQNHNIIVLDEAHKLRNEDTKTVEDLREVLNKSKRLLMLSGTPIYNDASDISSLVNSAAGRRVLPENKKDFESRFIKEKKVNPGLFRRLFLGVKPGTTRELKNQKQLKQVLDQYVDYYEPKGEAKAFYPTVDEETIKVPMSGKQQQIYQYLEGKIPPHLKWKIRMGLPPDKKELASLNSFASGLRQVANTHGPFKKLSSPDEAVSPKIETAVSNLAKRMQEDKNFRGLVYSNYLSAGIHPYEAALKKLGIGYGLITGQQTAKEKQSLVKDYNSGKIPVLLVSSSGGEGLDLIGTKLVQVMEPHWNRSKIQQVVGRGARYKSHTHLPKEEQKVHVEHYLSTVKQGPIDKLFKIKSKSIDEYLYDRMDEKEQIKNEVKDLMRGKKAKN